MIKTRPYWRENNYCKGAPLTAFQLILKISSFADRHKKIVKNTYLVERSGRRSGSMLLFSPVTFKMPTKNNF
jgi:hypothetical protein